MAQADTLNRLRVFISYARRDCSTFAEDLVAGLEAAGFDAFLDRHDISAGEDWEVRLGTLLQQADTVVFVISPASVESERCRWEVQRAVALAKRIIPVVAIDVPEEATPEELRRRNYIFFSQGHPFGAGLRALSAALRLDVEWIREHTRLGELAGRWRERGGSDALLLRSSELQAAQAWLKDWKPGAPEPTELHRAFLNASAAEEEKRQSSERQVLQQIAAAQEEKSRALERTGRANRRLALVSAALLFAAAAGGGYVLWSSLKLRQAQTALAQAETDLQQARAELEQANADAREKSELLLKAAQDLRAAQEAAAAAPAPAAAPGSPRRAISTLTQVRGLLGEAERQARLASGWDIDIFYCGDAQAELQPRARALANRLLAERERQLSGESSSMFSLGRVRVRELRPEVNAKVGYRISGVELRAEASEQSEADALEGFLAAEEPKLRRQTSGMATPYYLSVFVCR